MSGGAELYWLASPADDWRARVRDLARMRGDAAALSLASALADHRLNFQLTNMLASAVGDVFPAAPVEALATTPERLALLSSSTTTHLLPAIKMAALRRGLWLDLYENSYGLYRQELVDRASPLHGFAPTSVLFALDADHVAASVGACRSREQAAEHLARFLHDLAELWRLARERFGCTLMQQAIVPRAPALIGSNEHRHPGSAAAFIAAANHRLREACDAHGVDLVGVDARIVIDGLAAWHSRAYWLKAKQEITLTAAPMYGELVARLIAARRGRVAKCCVLDLDNTLWGGVVGDDGASGVVVGQGSARGEAFVAVQKYAQELRRRGVILAVCSKNDEAVARSPFETNPEMVLKLADFGCFTANWNDKATNLREIARVLNIGLDALVFVDDNPFERALVRRELPMVAVPELPAEPENYVACLADSGYFESVALTDEDFARASHYDPARRPPADGASATDLAAYLESLDMRLVWGEVDEASLPRVVQLINKTNQFNLTTRRYGEPELRAIMAEPSSLVLQFRLLDRFGDNGLVSVIILRAGSEGAMQSDRIQIDTWLMSCRVLGRRVEEAALNVVVEQAKRAGAREIIGVFLRTARNAMVERHYERLGFALLGESEAESTSALALGAFSPRATAIRICAGRE
ncbi:HAD family hydrolase [Methylosinus sp. Sm6]|uniref:HAD-IIIC family phosphatase n=1 Tax=Methylosinus sp. Sm6 TaxID=2866948 RepID=UPI001C99EB5D|nr:HAD-IIIC family phosphatase [Methylosinus sp. Sm6]MBY6241822.1 HAD-IIIC family phosphatase [Methylosinus sp. Sm6]